MADVAALIAGAEARASEMSSAASSALDSAVSALGVISFPLTPKVTMPGLTLPVLPQAPQLPAVTVPTQGARPTAPNIQAVDGDLGGVVAPTAPAGVLPSVTEPVKPTSAGAFNKALPTITIDAALPAAPAAFAGDMPALTAITLPDKPTITLPTFAGERPSDPGATPDVTAAYADTYRDVGPTMMRAMEGELDNHLTKINPEYHAQLGRLEAKLREYIEHPERTGLSLATEDAIYERSKSKISAETRRVQAEAMNTAAKLGFTLPSGALMAGLQQARQAGADNNSKAAVEIAVMQAEMQQKNMQFAVSTSLDLRKVALNSALAYHSNLININGQAVQYSQGLVSALVSTHDLIVKTFAAKLDGYRADVGLFETLIRASMNEVEIYKAEISAELAKVQVDAGRIQAYRAQIDAHQSAVETYSKQVDAVVAVAGLERLKIDMFRAEVDAYAAGVQGKTAEWQAYSAAWGGEESKVKAHLAQSQIYASAVEGYRARIQAEALKITAMSEQNQAALGAYTAQVGAYSAEVRAGAEIASAQISVGEALVQGYQVASQAVISQAGAAAEQYRALASVQTENARVRSSEIIESARMMANTLEARSRIAVSAGGVYAGMAQAALTGVNTLVSAEQA